MLSQRVMSVTALSICLLMQMISPVTTASTENSSSTVEAVSSTVEAVSSTVEAVSSTVEAVSSTVEAVSSAGASTSAAGPAPPGGATSDKTPGPAPAAGPTSDKTPGSESSAAPGPKATVDPSTPLIFPDDWTAVDERGKYLVEDQYLGIRTSQGTNMAMTYASTAIIGLCIILAVVLYLYYTKAMREGTHELRQEGEQAHMTGAVSALDMSRIKPYVKRSSASIDSQDAGTPEKVGESASASADSGLEQPSGKSDASKSGSEKSE